MKRSQSTPPPHAAALLNKLRRSIVANKFTSASIVVAFSGGPDSTALLHSLHTLKDEFKLKLHAAHLDHGLRAEASQADADFAHDFAQSLDIPFVAKKVDTYALRAERRLSIEDAARKLRYKFLSKAVLERGANCIALGHTLNDQAETVLMRALRGSGLEGLSAMREVSTTNIGGPQVNLYRPLLSVSRTEIIHYCSENRLAPRMDESNLSIKFTRNRIRLELMPKLEEYNPSVRHAFARLADSASMDMDFIRRETERAAENAITVNSDRVAIQRDRFLLLHPAIGHHLLRMAVRLTKGDAGDLEFQHVSNMFDMMRGESGKSLDLPGNVRFQVDYAHAHVLRADAPSSPMPSMDAASIALEVPGTTIVGGWKVSSRYIQNHYAFDHADSYEPRLTERFDADAISDAPLVRTRRAGDYFQPLGMTSEKKLKNFMIDSRVPRLWRASTPLVESNGRIAWVVGWRIADWAKVLPDTRKTLEMRFENKLER